MTGDRTPTGDLREHFAGLADSECGEHRTVGARAWCYRDGEWCYPDAPCRGCELPALRVRAEEAERQRDDYRQRFANQMTAATELTTTLREAERKLQQALEAIADERRGRLAAEAAVRRAREKDGT